MDLYLINDSSGTYTSVPFSPFLEMHDPSIEISSNDLGYRATQVVEPSSVSYFTFDLNVEPNSSSRITGPVNQVLSFQVPDATNLTTPVVAYDMADPATKYIIPTDGSICTLSPTSHNYNYVIQNQSYVEGGYDHWKIYIALPGANPSTPDESFFNPNGTPYATITGTGNVSSALYDNHIGVWTLGGPDSSMDLGIPNTAEDHTRYKEVWTQITWQPEYLDEPAPVVAVNGIPSAPVHTYVVGTDGWFQSVYDTRLAYNPQYEDVVVTGSYDLGEVLR